MRTPMAAEMVTAMAAVVAAGECRRIRQQRNGEHYWQCQLQ